MPKYRVTKGRVYARAGDVVEMDEESARKFGARLEPVKPGPKPKKEKSELHVQPAGLEGSDERNEEVKDGADNG